MVTVSECAFGGGMPTMGGNGKAFCDGGVHTGKPIDLIVHPGTTVNAQFEKELAEVRATTMKHPPRKP